MLRSSAILGLVLACLAPEVHAATLSLSGSTLTLALDGGSAATLTDDGGQLVVDVGEGFTVDANTAANLVGFEDGRVSSGIVLTVATLVVTGGPGASLTIDLDSTLAPALSVAVPATIARELEVNGAVTLLAPATLRGSMSAAGDMQLAAATLGANVTLRADSVFGTAELRLTGPIDGDGTPRALTLIADEMALADLGATTPIASITIDADLVACEAGQIIKASGPITTTAVGNMLIPGALDVSSGGGTIMLGEINAASGELATPIVIDARSAPTVAGNVTLAGIGGSINVDSLFVWAGALALDGDAISKLAQTFQVASVTVAERIIAPYSAVTFLPLDPTTSIGLGDGASAGLVLDDDVLAAVVGESTRLVIGSPTQTGSITASAQGAAFPCATELVIGGSAGDVDLSAGSVTAASNLTISAPGNVVLGPLTVSGDLALTSATAVTQVGALNAQTLAVAGSGDVTLDHVQNLLDQVSGSIGGPLVLQNSEGRRLRLGGVAASALTINSADVAGPVLANGDLDSRGGPVLVHGRAATAPDPLPAILVSADILAQSDAASGATRLVALAAPGAPGLEGVNVTGGAAIRSNQPDGVEIDAQSGTGPAVIVSGTPSSVSSDFGLVIRSRGGELRVDGAVDGGTDLTLHGDHLTLGASAAIAGDVVTIESESALMRLGGDGLDAVDLLALSIAELSRVDAASELAFVGTTVENVEALTRTADVAFDGTEIRLDADVIAPSITFLGPTTVLRDVALTGDVQLAAGVTLGLAQLAVSGAVTISGPFEVQIDAVASHGMISAADVELVAASLQLELTAVAALGDVVILVEVTGANPPVGVFQNYAPGTEVVGTQWRVGYALTGNDVGLFSAAPPSEADDTATVAEDGTILVDVLANDDAATALALDAVTDPPHGTATIEGDEVRYVPDANYHGADTFTYTACDAYGQCATGTVTMTVTPVNDAPTAVADAVSTNEEVAVSIPVLANDTDVDGHALTVASVNDPFPDGTLTIEGDQLLFTPAIDVVGTVTLTYTVRDAGGLEASGTVTVTVLPDLDDDDDGVSDDEEATLGTDKDDRDSDDDGVIDGDEVEDGLDPNDPDTDGDGVQDGTELGLTSGDGDTDLQVFVPDADPSSTTDPALVDTDGGGATDGEEDEDHDGEVDDGERDPRDVRDDLRGHVTGGGCSGSGDAPVGLWLAVGALALLGRRRARA